jgi:hypothetical protein
MDWEWIKGTSSPNLLGLSLFGREWKFLTLQILHNGPPVLINEL